MEKEKSAKISVGTHKKICKIRDTKFWTIKRIIDIAIDLLESEIEKGKK